MAFVPRKAILKEDCALIPLGVNAKGGYAIVDIDDTWVEKYPWTLLETAGGYATTTIDGHIVLLHRFLIKAGKSDIVDHKNVIPLDCRRSNLRICTRAENNRNRDKAKKNPLYKGVEVTPAGKYRARIRKDKKQYHLGCFSTAKEAAIAYNKAAIIMFGEFGRANNV